ncbi:MAG: hydroxymethylpyrimidine/phosphomethylpyrimidine kinase [Planctomycetota bacterium]
MAMDGAPRIALFGGLDPSGGAGLTLDAAVVAQAGGQPLPITLAVTVQSLRGFQRFDAVAEATVRDQFEAVLGDAAIAAVKVGFVPGADHARLVAELIDTLRPSVPVIVDPILSATAGGMQRAAGELRRAYREFLVPRATVLTPNQPELDALAGGDVGVLLDAGARFVLAKGGHGGDPQRVVDELWRSGGSGGSAPERFVRPRLDCGPVRGTGCALASRLACLLGCRLARPPGSDGSSEDADLAGACREAGVWLAGLLARVEKRADGLPSTLPLA